MNVYKRAPITEAIIELRGAEKSGEDAMSKVAGKLKERYPNLGEQKSIEVNFDATGGGDPVIRNEVRSNGYRLTSSDQADIVIVGQSLISTARLAPYPGWDEFFLTAQNNWGIWRKFNKRTKIKRIGVRYINRIDVPTGSDSITLANYVNFYPFMPVISPHPMIGFLSQITKPTSDPKWVVTLTSTMITPPPLLRHLSILLDMDVYREDDIPTSDDYLWETIESARSIKNDLFERCITDRARDLFNI